MQNDALKRFLDAHETRYVTIAHSPAYTAQEIAASAHVSGKELAKTVIVRVDGQLAMAVLRASDRIDLDLLRSALDAGDVVLAEEAEFAARFPGMEAGAMPPFGHLFDMPVFVDETLTHERHVAFNAGSHAELVRLERADFMRLAEPRVLRFAAD